jgi:hypothetical protein
VHLVGDHLFAEIRSGVDHDCRFATIGAELTDQERRAGTPVLRICRITGAPVAIYPRHARRGGAAKNSELAADRYCHSRGIFE